jgi:predicted DsbA family dithiol-disulfide isomerase
LVASSLERLSQSHAVDLHWRSFELRPRGAPPLPAAYRARIEAARPQLYAVARQNYGLELNPGPFGIYSRPALVGAKYAEAQGQGAAFHRAVMTAYWQEAKRIDDRQTLTQLAQAAGLEKDAFSAALADPLYESQVQEDIALAVEYGLNGVPALVFANKYLLSGAQPLAVLQRLVERIQMENSVGE